VASIFTYIEGPRKGKYAKYHLAYAAHYIGDLSQPFHNSKNDVFNQTRHSINDGTVEDEVLANINKIEEHMYPIKLERHRFRQDLAAEIARIANLSRKLRLKLEKEKRDMTKEEAYKQLGHSASLLRAVLKHL
jgi:hypothetical protein